MRPRLTLWGAREIQWQTNGKDMPHLAKRRRGRVEFRAENGGESGCAKGARVYDRITVFCEKMIGQGQKIIACLTIGGANRLGATHTV